MKNFAKFRTPTQRITTQVSADLYDRILTVLENTTNTTAEIVRTALEKEVKLREGASE